MLKTKYNSIGKTYTKTRQADPRIVQEILSLLNLKCPATIADIGAGTGNYAHALADSGYNVMAVEPSDVMQNQASYHPKIKWKTGVAENIPLEDHSVDGIICILATHHFQDLERAFEEMNRILKADGKIVVFTYAPDYWLEERFWLFDYFPVFLEDDSNRFLPIKQTANLLAAKTNRPIEIKPFLLPNDLKDSFLAAAWQTPEKYLDTAFQAGSSSFATPKQHIVKAGLEQLKKDLEDGTWHYRYGGYLKFDKFDAGYRFVYTI